MIIDTNSKPKNNIIGTRFGNLEVIDFFQYYHSGTRSKRPLWLCLCDCGNLSIKSQTDLNGRLQPRCRGCAYATRKQSTQRVDAWERLFNLTIKNRAKKKQIFVSLTISQFKKIASKSCEYCGNAPKLKSYLYTNNIYAIGKEIYANGIDRVDNSKGYEITNVVSCCDICNRAKGALSLPDFKEWIQRISKYQELKNASNKK